MKSIPQFDGNATNSDSSVTNETVNDFESSDDDDENRNIPLVKPLKKQLK